MLLEIQWVNNLGTAHMETEMWFVIGSRELEKGILKK